MFPYIIVLSRSLNAFNACCLYSALSIKVTDRFIAVENNSPIFHSLEKHFGEKSGFKGYLWGILLASTTVGGLYVAFPVAYSLYSKGAKLGVIFTYIGASAICRVPMTIFEASFLGVKFSAIRLLVAIPLVVITSMLLGNYLRKRNYRIVEGK